MHERIQSRKEPAHRLEDYKYHFCFDRKGNGLGIVLDVKAFMTSAVSLTNTIFVKSIKSGEIFQQVYYGDEISLLEPVDTPVEPIDISCELDELQKLVDETLQDKIEFGWTEHDALAVEHDQFFKNVRQF